MTNFAKGLLSLNLVFYEQSVAHYALLCKTVHRGQANTDFGFSITE